MAIKRTSKSSKELKKAAKLEANRPLTALHNGVHIPKVTLYVRKAG